MAKKPDDKGKGEDSDDTAKSLEGLTKVFGDMTKQLEAMPGQVAAAVTSGIQTASADHQRQLAANAAGDDDDDDDDDEGAGTGDSEVDLEKLSRAEFANSIMKNFNKVLQKTLKPLEKSLNTTAETAERDRVAQRFIATRETYKDFDDWKEEMGDLVKARGYLDPEELYIIAKSKNPEKVKQLADKADEKEKADKELKEAEAGKKPASGDKPSFLGLMPTSSAGTTGGEGEPKYTSTKDAAEAAFDDILGNVSEEIIGEANVG